MASLRIAGRAVGAVWAAAAFVAETAITRSSRNGPLPFGVAPFPLPVLGIALRRWAARRWARREVARLQAMMAFVPRVR